MLDLVFVFIVYVSFVVLFSTTRFVESKFANFLLIILFLVSLYAVIRTHFLSFFSIYIFGFIFWFIYKLLKKEINFRLKFNYFDTIIGILIWLLFVLIYFDFSNFYILAPGNALDDISVYSSVAKYNDNFGVENTRGVYNLFDVSPKLELYHHFELWMMNLGHYLNGANRTMNLILFVFPTISYLCYLGIRETLNFNIWSSFNTLLLFFLVIWPYDLFVNFLDIGLPRGGGGAIILNTKNVLVLPILISLIHEIRQKSTQFYLTAITLFFYPLLIPLISTSLFTYTFLFSKNSIKNLWAHFGLILVIFAFMFFIPNSHPGLDLYSIFDFSILPKIIFVSLITPLVSFGFYWILIERNIGLGKLKELILFFLISMIFSIVFWHLFKRNIDSNQFFRNLFIPFCSLSIAVGIVVFFSKKAYFHALLGVSIFVIPVVTVLGKSKMNHPTDELLNIGIELNRGERILFFPDPKMVNSVFMFNERMFLPRDISQLGNFSDDIHILGTVSFLNSKSFERNDIAVEMINYYKSISPIFQACGDSLNQVICIREFAAKYNFQRALIHKNNPYAPYFNSKVLFQNYFFADLKN